MSFISLKDVLLKSAERLHSKNKGDLILLEEAWGSACENLNINSNKIKLISLKKGSLCLGCESSSEAANLKLYEKKIKERLNRVLKKNKIKKIKFKIHGRS